MKDEYAEGYREITHTADIAVQVWSRSMSGLFDLSIRALRDQFKYVSNAEQKDQNLLVHIRAVDDLACLIQLLNEVLYQFDLGRICTHLQIDRIGQGELLGNIVYQVIGERTAVIKAITYHGGDISNVNGKFSVTLVFDA